MLINREEGQRERVRLPVPSLMNGYTHRQKRKKIKVTYIYISLLVTTPALLCELC